MGLAYVNKWYNIDFGAVNLRDLLVFRQDFYGSRKSPIDWLIELGKDYYHLDPQKNTETLVKYVSPYARHVDVVELLESTRQQFTTTRDFDEWFRGTTKAHVVETPSLELPDHDVRASERFKRTKYKAALLPVLTVRENDIFIMVHMTSVTMGSFERYYDKRHLSAEQRAGKIEEIKRRIQYYAQRYRDYYDMWYRVSSDKAKRHLLNDIPAWDGYGTAAGWSAQYGSSAIRSVEDFFGPIGKWYQASPVGAYSSGDATFMVHTKSLEPYGITIFTHEMVHNLDRFVFLGGEGRRIYVLPEMYPVSLLQNPTTRSSGAFGFNQSADFSNHNGWYLHNAHPDRFQTMTDMDQYFKGYFNAIYLLDLAEAEAMIGQSPEALSKMLMKLGNHVTQGVTVNSYDALSAQDIADMRLASINDMIDHSLMMRRVNAPTNGPIERNGYPNVTILDPIYGTGESSVGTTGETAFRRNALELWAAKGFEEGFVPYTSSRLLGEARREGAGDMPDTFIMPKIFASDPYSTLKDYRKQAYAMIRQRATTHLQPITVSFDGIQETYTTLEELATRFRELMAEDIAHSRQGSTRSKVYRFKGEVFSQLMRQTQEFKSSMFTDDVDQLLPWTMLRKPEATVRVPLPALERPSLDRSQEKFAVPPTASLDEAMMTELRRQVTDAETQVRHAQEAFRAADSELLDNQETLKTFQLRRDNRNEALTSARQAMARAEAEARKAVDALGFSRDRKIASEAQIQQLDSHIEHLLSALATLRQRVAVHQSAFDHAQQLRQERSAEVEQMFRRFSEAQEEFAAAEASLKNAQQSLTDTLAQLRAVEARILQDSTQREDRDREVLRLQSLRALMLAFEAAKQLSDAADLGHASVLDRLTRAEQTTERAQTRVEELAATVSRLQERQRHLAGLTVDALLIGSQTEEAPQIVEGLQELRRRIALVQDALRRYEDAQQDISRHSAALAALQQDRENAQVALMQARVDLDRLKTTLSEQNGGDEYSCVPRVAPYLPYLPSYEIEVLPGNAPVVESLPTYEIGSVSEPETIVPSSPQADSAEHTTHDLVPYGTSIESTFEHQPNAQSAQNNPVTLARTGGGTAMLGTISAIGAALGIAALRGRRRRE